MSKKLFFELRYEELEIELSNIEIELLSLEMKNHTKVYMNYFGYDISDFIPCELTGNKCIDIHHIDSRGLGGSKQKDVIENLMGMTRELHGKYGDKKQHMEFLQEAHSAFMKDQIPWIKRKGAILP